MNYDIVLPYLSKNDKFGKYQKKIYVLLSIPTVLCAFHKLAGVFLLGVPDYRCRLPGEPSNATFSLSNDLLRSSIPFDSVKNEFSKCTYFDDSANHNESDIRTCNEFIWDSLPNEYSAVQSFNLVCDRSTLRASADSLMMFGVLIGSYVFGDLSDRYGRKPIFMISLLIQAIFGLLTSFAPEFITYSICRMIVGASTSGIILVSYCLSLEMVNKQSRLYAGTVVMMFFSAGYIIMGAMAYYVQDWRWLQVSISLPSLIFVGYWWIIPESSRWLLANNRKDEAVKIINKVARANNLAVPKDILERLECDKVEKGKKPSLFALFRTPYLRFKTILIFFNWFIISGAYYGLSWSTKSLGGNLYLNFIISGVVEFPACIFLIFTLNRYGRKLILSGSMILCALSLLTSLIIPKSLNWLIIGFAMLGKMSVTAAYGTIYIFSAEQFPTVIRNVALGAASMSARVGGVAAPYLNFLSQFWEPAPYAIFGFATLFGGFLCTFLPETYNKELPETLDDGERLGKKSADEKHPEEVNLKSTT